MVLKIVGLLTTYLIVKGGFVAVSQGANVNVSQLAQRGSYALLASAYSFFMF